MGIGCFEHTLGVLKVVRFLLEGLGVARASGLADLAAQLSGGKQSVIRHATFYRIALSKDLAHVPVY